MSTSSEERQLLVDRFVASFDRLTDLTANGTDPIALELATGDPGQLGFREWRPIKVNTDRSALDRIYENLPGRLPPLFELLLLSYRWAQVDLRLYRLIANPPGSDLGGFVDQISKDPWLWKYLKPAGYIQFGRGPDLDHDPICFDMRARKKNGDCRVVKIYHEEILCNNRVKIRNEVAPSFQELLLRTIEQVK